MDTMLQKPLLANLKLRATVVAQIRAFFDQRGYLEVETPHRIPAPAPEIHIEAYACGDWFLHTSPELCMKRLLAAGCQRIYQICRCFRQAERGQRHLPEFTLLEWYCAGIDYIGMMAETESLLRHVADRLGRSHGITYQGRRITWQEPWLRLTVAEAFKRYGSLGLAEALAAERFDEILTSEIEPQLGHPQPVFLYDYPPELGALARLGKSSPPVAERFELYIAGLELCNAFSELTDGKEQRQRFARDRILRRQAGKQDYPLPVKFLDALARMPPAAGNALGLDRLVMLLANAPHIDEVVAFTPEEL